MSENTTDVTETETEDQQDVEQEENQKPTETVDFWKSKAREQEKRAKENAAAAKRLAELEDAQKSETEKFTERLSKAEAEAASVPGKVSEALRSHLVKLHGIDKEDAELFLTASDPDLLLKQVDRLVGQPGKRKRQGNFVPREGTTNPAVETDARAFARNLFGGD
ncbi:hypothetical protein [Rhodococcus sp. 5G237]